MTPFTKYWIGATIAPESIQVVRESSIGALIVVHNEARDKKMILIEDITSNTIVGIGKTYDECIAIKSLPYAEACCMIVEEFGITSYSVQ